MLKVGDLVVFSSNFNRFIYSGSKSKSNYQNEPIAVVYELIETNFTKEKVFWVKFLTGHKIGEISGPHFGDELQKISI
jgi:hypothetical protein